MTTYFVDPIASAGEEDLPNGSGPYAGLLMLLVLVAGGAPLAGQERDRGQVVGPMIGPREGESWRAPDARVVKTEVVRPVPQAFHDRPSRGGARKVEQSSPAGDFWTPDELRRVQPPRGSFRAPSEDDNAR